MGLLAIVAILGLTFYALKPVSPSGTSSGLVLPTNAVMPPGNYDGRLNQSTAWTPVVPESPEGQAFFGFLAQPDPMNVRQAHVPGDVVTAVLAGEPTAETAGRRPLLLAYFDVLRKHGPSEGLLAGTYDLQYAGTANENTDVAAPSVSTPPPTFQLTGVSPDFVAQGVGKA